jgi:hypothetical protein
VLPRETAYIQKASVIAKNNGGKRTFAADQLVREALTVQNERFEQQLAGKNEMIQRQQKVMI